MKVTSKVAVTNIGTRTVILETVGNVSISQQLLACVCIFKNVYLVVAGDLK